MSEATLLYAALGDSTGVGVGARDGRGGYVARLFARLRSRMPGARLMNLCVSGATSRGVVSAQLAHALSAAPQVATVFMGINDLIQGVAPATFASHVERVASALEEQRTRVLFCTLPDLAHAPAAQYFMRTLGVQRALFETRTLAFNQQITESAERYGHAVQDLFAVPLRDRAHFFSEDGFHPSAQGYEELAETLWPAFAALVPGA